MLMFYIWVVLFIGRKGGGGLYLSLCGVSYVIFVRILGTGASKGLEVRDFRVNIWP